MDHQDHVALLHPAVAAAAVGATWADIGSGSGAFTLALAELIGPGATIVSVDRDAAALREQARLVTTRFPQTVLDQRVADLRNGLDLPLLDGLVMANALHFVPHQEQAEVVRGLAEHLRPRAPFVVVEYDADRGNPYVPYPFRPSTWATIAETAGLDRAAEIGRVPSRWLGAIWSGVGYRPAGGHEG